jgi:hypothetical protein
MINTYQREQNIVSAAHATVNLIKLGYDLYQTYLTGKYVDPFTILPVDPRLVTFVEKLTREDKERLFYHMLSKMPPQELKRIRSLAGIVD